MSCDEQLIKPRRNLLDYSLNPHTAKFLAEKKQCLIESRAVQFCKIFKRRSEKKAMVFSNR